MSWDETRIELAGGGRIVKRRINLALEELLMESVRLRDESAIDTSRGPAEGQPQNENGSSADLALEGRSEKEMPMGVKEKLQEFTSVDGFAGVGLYTPTGESLGAFKTDIGVLANAVLPSCAGRDSGTSRPARWAACWRAPSGVSSGTYAEAACSRWTRTMAIPACLTILRAT